MMQESLARKLRVLRAERGITLQEAEELTGVTRETLGALEHGQRGAYTNTLQKIAEGYGITVGELLEEPVPLDEAPPPSGLPEKSEEERSVGYLRAWRGFVYKLVLRWEQDPPESGREIAVVLDAMQALLDEGAFERPPEQITTSDKREASEWLELSSLFRGIDRLNRIADAVEADAEAERWRATFRKIEGQMVG